jgi:hypothetical protein
MHRRTSTILNSVMQAGLYPEATRCCVRISSDAYAQRVSLLQACIKYEQDELVMCKAQLDQCAHDDPDVIINYAAVAFKEVCMVAPEQARDHSCMCLHGLHRHAQRVCSECIFLCVARTLTRHWSRETTRERARSSWKLGQHSVTSRTSRTTLHYVTTSRSNTDRH